MGGGEATRNRLKERLSEGRTCVGTWVTIGNNDVVALLRNLEFDCFVFDLEHAPLDWQTVSNLIQLINTEGAAPLVRLASNDEVSVKKSLDMGAQGVIVPLINSAEEAARAVSFSKYPPQGTRGVGPRGASNFGLDQADYLRRSNEESLVFAIVESKRGVENIGEIARVTGLDGVVFGYADFAMSSGLLNDYSNPEVAAAKRAIVEACRRSEKVPAIFAPSVKDAADALGIGFRLVFLGSDTLYLLSGARLFLDAVRGR